MRGHGINHERPENRPPNRLDRRRAGLVNKVKKQGGLLATERDG
jgi:hypothetical protein